MYRLIIVIVVACIGMSCKKELSKNLGDQVSIASIDLTSDDENIIKDYAPRQPNEFSQYSFGGFAGNYFGYVSSFRISEKEKIEIRFGTVLSQNSMLTSKETLMLISPGKKNFGSLGVYSSYPQIKPGCAEIAFTDKKSTRWSSTKITERQTSYGIKTTVEISQPGSEFIIDKVLDITVSDTIPGYRVTGHFTCRIYEVNGQRTKHLKGNFSGIIGNSN